MRDHVPIPIVQFNGRFARGEDEVCPRDHAFDELNCEFFEGGVKSRSGFDSYFQATGSWNGVVTSSFEYKKRGEASRLLVLDGNGRIWDLSSALATPILDIPAMTDFSAVTIFERCYITPHDGDVGLSNESVYVYDGSGVARVAAGNAPSGYTLAVVDSATAGNIEKGTHLFSVAFETVSGHITKLGTVGAEIKNYNAPGGKQADISGIPIGDSSVTARHILVTPVIKDYNGNPEEQSWFFLPGGRIPNNTATTKTGVSFFDASLIDRADRLFNQLNTIPAGSCIAAYGSRMVVGGAAANNATVRASEPGFPESMSDLVGFVNVYPGDAGGAIHNLLEYRGILHCFKDYRTYATRDNGTDPSTWDVMEIDGAFGTSVHGAGGVLDSKGQSNDTFLICSRTGVHNFTGTYGNAPELTYKIEDLWERVNPAAFHKIRISVDPVIKRFYISVPLDNETESNFLFVCDAAEGLDAQHVKWSVWQTVKKFSSHWVEVDFATKITKFKFGSSGGGVYVLNPVALNDFANAITAFYTPGFVTVDPTAGGTCSFHVIRMKVRGSGSLDMTLYGMDRVLVSQIPSFLMTPNPGSEAYRIINFVSDKMALEFGVDAFNEWFRVTAIRFGVKVLWPEQIQV